MFDSKSFFCFVQLIAAFNKTIMAAKQVLCRHFRKLDN